MCLVYIYMTYYTCIAHELMHACAIRKYVCTVCVVYLVCAYIHVYIWLIYGVCNIFVTGIQCFVYMSLSIYICQLDAFPPIYIDRCIYYRYIHLWVTRGLVSWNVFVVLVKCIYSICVYIYVYIYTYYRCIDIGDRCTYFCSIYLYYIPHLFTVYVSCHIHIYDMYIYICVYHIIS